jgi:hypothetical protein
MMKEEVERIQTKKQEKLDKKIDQKSAKSEINSEILNPNEEEQKHHSR